MTTRTRNVPAAKESIELLLSGGADLETKDSSGSTVLDNTALGYTPREVFEFLLTKGAKIRSIHLATYQGDVDRVKSFMKEGVDVNEKKTINQLTPLDYAVRGGEIDAVRFLISEGADVNGGAKDMPALMWAVTFKKARIVEYLLANGANTNVRGGRGDTPLLQAIRADRPSLSLIETLISGGADVNAKDRIRGAMPVHLAVFFRGDKDLVELLIASGADINVKNRRGQTPLDLAKLRGHTEIVEILTKAAEEPTVVHDVAVTKVSAAPNCGQGETISIVVTLDSRGGGSKSRAVNLVNAADDREISRQSATVHSKYWVASEADQTFTGEVEDETEFGNWCCADGDVNGDGFNDLLITAHHYPSMSISKGRAYLYYGGAQMNNTPDKRFTGKDIGDTLGGNAGLLVDMNNDNFDDVILGARYYGADDLGRVYVFYGGMDMDERADIVVDPPDGEGTNLSFGRGGMSAADFNGDGHMDLACRAGRYGSRTGRVYLYYGPLASDTIVDKTFTGENTSDLFGAIMGVGDVDGDNCDDLLIATRHYPGGDNRGRAYLYYGATGTSMDTTCDVTFDAPDGGTDEFGSSADLFDIDNDGFADVLIGARRYPDGKSIGRVYVYCGRANGFDNTVGLTITGEATSSAFGGDFINCRYADDDQYGDILITAYGYNRQQSRAYLYNGGPQGSMDAVADCIFTPEPGKNGVYRSALADLNNDGYGDVVMGGVCYNNLQGRAWLWYGSFTTSADITFTWDTTNASIGKHTLKVEIPPVPGERNTEYNTKTVTIEVKEPMR